MKAEFTEKTGTISFHHAETPDIKINSSPAWVRYRLESGQVKIASFSDGSYSLQEQSIVDVHGTASLREIRGEADSYGIALTYRMKLYPSRPFMLLQLSLQNQSQTPIFLDDFCLLSADRVHGGQLEMKPPQSGFRFFKVGWLGWSYTGLRTARDRNTTSWLDRITSQSYLNPATPRPRRAGEFWGEGWGVLVGEQAAIVAGFVSTAQQFSQVYACTRPGATALMLTTQLDGIRLDPGETCDSEWGYLQFIPLPSSEPQADFLEAVQRQMHALVPASPPPPMWTHWYQFYHDISEQRFLETLDFLSQKRDVLPLQFAELDDGYQSAWGDWLTTNAKFPHGLEWLAGQVRQRGFMPGLWLAPFAAESKSDFAHAHPDWLVKDRRGKPTSAGFVYNMSIHALDLTHPAVLDHLRELASTLTQQWGFGMLKIDFLITAALPGYRSNPKQTRAEALRAGLQAIREGAGQQNFLLGCGCPFGPAIGLVDAMRIGPDTAPFWRPYFHWLSWAKPLISNNPSMPALRNALRNTLNLNSTHKRLWWNDPDCLLVRDEDSHLSEAEVQSELSLIGLSGGLFISSDDLRKLSPQRLNWVSRLAPNLGLHGLPLDEMQRDMPATYRVRLQKGEQKWQLVALFNWEDHPAELHLQPSDLDYPSGTELHVFDFWTAQHQQTSESTLVFSNVPPHGCKLLRLCQMEGEAQIVGDTLHISMGLEVDSILREGDRLEIKLLDLGRRLEGELWLRSDDELREAWVNGRQGSVEAQGLGIYLLSIST